MGEYLDKTGLAYFWSKIKEYIPAKSKKTESLYFGYLDSTSTRTVMTAQISGITELYTGLCIFIKNDVAASNTNVTLNVNSLGAKKIYSSQSATAHITTQWAVGYTALLIYDASKDEGNGGWTYFYGYDSNTNTIGYHIRTEGVTLPMKERVYRYRLLFENLSGEYIPANTSTSTNSTTARTPTTEPINPFGRISYYSTTSAVQAGNSPGASYQYQQYSGITLGYSFTGVTLTASEPLYLVTNPTSNGLVTIDQTTPITQTLPSTEDNKIYIFLGIASSATAFTLTLQHPVYVYKGGRIREWSDAYIPAVPTEISDLTNDQIYDLGTLTLNNYRASITAQQYTDIVAMWNRGFCCVTATVNGGKYYALKQDTLVEGNDTAYVFSGTQMNIFADGVCGIAIGTSEGAYYAYVRVSYIDNELAQNAYDTATRVESNFNSHAADTDIHVTAQDKTNWDAKYEKPSGGIPASDIASGVIPTVPSNVSAFTNDAGYLTSGTVPQEVFLITVTPTNQMMTTGTSDKTSAEIYAAAVAGKLPVVVVSAGVIKFAAPFALALEETSSGGGLEYQVFFSYDNQKAGSAIISGLPKHSTISITGTTATMTHIMYGFATGDLIPENVSQLYNDSGYITGITSSDVTTALGYTPYELPSGGITSNDLDSNVQTSLDLANSALQSFTESDPTVPAWAKASSKPSYSAEEISFTDVSGPGISATNVRDAISEVASSDAGKVSATLTVNGHALSSNVTITASDVGAVPTARTVNGKALSSDISLGADDISYQTSSGTTVLGQVSDVAEALDAVDTYMQGLYSSSGGDISGNVILKAPAGSSSPSLTFQRGTLTDNYNDWNIQDVGGYLRFYERGQNSGAWNERVVFNTTGGITATTFSGQLSGTISSSTTATTQTAGDSSTKVATTAFVATAITNALAAYENGNTSTY